MDKYTKNQITTSSSKIFSNNTNNNRINYEDNENATIPSGSQLVKSYSENNPRKLNGGNCLSQKPSQPESRISIPIQFEDKSLQMNNNPNLNIKTAGYNSIIYRSQTPRDPNTEIFSYSYRKHDEANNRHSGNIRSNKVVDMADVKKSNQNTTKTSGTGVNKNDNVYGGFESSQNGFSNNSTKKLLKSSEWTSLKQHVVKKDY